MRRKLGALGLVVATFIAAPNVPACTLPVTLGELVVYADLIVIGTVETVPEYATRVGDPPQTFTLQTISVSEVLKGEDRSAEITVATRGGKVRSVDAEGRERIYHQTVSPSAELPEAGGEVLLFLSRTRLGYRVAYSRNGYARIERDLDGRRVVLLHHRDLVERFRAQPDRAVVELGRPLPPAPSTWVVITLSELRAAIAGALERPTEER